MDKETLTKITEYKALIRLAHVCGDSAMVRALLQRIMSLIDEGRG